MKKNISVSCVLNNQDCKIYLPSPKEHDVYSVDESDKVFVPGVFMIGCSQSPKTNACS